MQVSRMVEHTAIVHSSLRNNLRGAKDARVVRDAQARNRLRLSARLLRQACSVATPIASWVDCIQPSIVSLGGTWIASSGCSWASSWIWSEAKRYFRRSTLHAPSWTTGHLYWCSYLPFVVGRRLDVIVASAVLWYSVVAVIAVVIVQLSST